MHKKELEDIKAYFEGYELMNKLMDEGLVVAVRTSIQQNKRTGAVSIKVIERNLRSINRFNKSGDNLFCDVRIERNKIKFTFKLRQDTVRKFENQALALLERKYTCKMLGTTITIEHYNATVNNIIEIFTTMEPLCRKLQGD
jgi:hypothetical protein